MRYEYETESWKLNISTRPRYSGENPREETEDSISDLIMSCAEQVLQETGVYVSASVQTCRMLYRKEWGCPEGGETCFLLQGTRNPLFAEKSEYEKALLRLVEILKTKLEQNAVYLEIAPMRLIYMADEVFGGAREAEKKEQN